MESKPAVEVSVIVAAYGAEATIGRTVAALRAQTLAPERYEVIVVDDGSRDQTAQVAREAGARVIVQANAGPAAARNRGVAEAVGRLIVFTDADCEPEPDFLERLLEPLFEGRARASKGAYRTRQRAWVARLVQIEYESRYDRMARVQEQCGGIDFIDTYAAAFFREDFEAVGGFDTSFPGASVEDQELSFRLARRGVTMRFVPDARVWHLHADRWWAYARKKARIGYWKVAVLRRHPERVVHDSHTPQGLKLEVAFAGTFALGLASSPVALAYGAAPLVAFGPPLGSALMLLVLWVPFLIRVARSAPGLLPWTPLFLLTRALALGVGLFGGLSHGVRLAPVALEQQRELEAGRS